MTKIGKVIATFISTYVLCVGAIWGLLEGYTYFGNEALKESIIGSYWPVVIYGFPAIITLLMICTASNQSVDNLSPSKPSNLDAIASPQTASEKTSVANTRHQGEIDALLRVLELDTNLQPIQPNEISRWDAAVRLSELGDPRVTFSHPTYWCKVEADSYVIGTKSNDLIANRYEREQFEVTVQSFHIARYPVTNEQWKHFIEDKGYSNRVWWKKYWPICEKYGWRNPAFWEDDRLNIGNQPVVGVSWYEAQAYITWLTEQLGYSVFLPTEVQWEVAARGRDERRFPWGNESDSSRANVEGRAEKPTSVGCYPHGASPFGVLDMSGNIYEWTATPWNIRARLEIKSRPSNSTEFVCRGGAWPFALNGATCTARYHFSPYQRLEYIGLRLACDIG